MREITEDAVDNTEIKFFVELVRADMHDGVIDFSILKNRSYMKYWCQLSMTEYVEGEDTFMFIYMGTSLATYIGRDYTGMTTREVFEDNVLNQASHDMNLDVVRNKRILFSIGDIEFEDKKFMQWLSVSMPLKKEASLPLCLTYSVFNK